MRSPRPRAACAATSSCFATAARSPTLRTPNSCWSGPSSATASTAPARWSGCRPNGRSASRPQASRSSPSESTSKDVRTMAKTERNFVYPQDVDSFVFDWGRLALTVAPGVNGAGRFSGGVVDLGPGQGHARHNHPGAEEIIFVIAGEGEQMVEDAAGRPVVAKVGAGCTVYV